MCWSWREIKKSPRQMFDSSFFPCWVSRKVLLIVNWIKISEKMEINSSGTEIEIRNKQANEPCHCEPARKRFLYRLQPLFDLCHGKHRRAENLRTVISFGIIFASSSNSFVPKKAAVVNNFTKSFSLIGCACRSHRGLAWMALRLICMWHCHQWKCWKRSIDKRKKINKSPDDIRYINLRPTW